VKSWCDLSWREKCKIQEGNVNSFKYSFGYDSRVRNKVRENQEKRDEQEKNKTISISNK